MSAVIGYAWVSTSGQEIAAQEAALIAAGARRVFIDRGVSSRGAARPQWLACWDHLRPGDTLLVERLDRLADGESMAVDVINALGARGVELRSLSEPDIDTTTATGRVLFGITAVLAQLRVDTIRDGTRRDVAHARPRGRFGGRPSVMTVERLDAARALRAQGRSLDQIAAVLGVGSSSVQRALTKARDVAGREEGAIARGI